MSDTLMDLLDAADAAPEAALDAAPETAEAALDAAPETADAAPEAAPEAAEATPEAAPEAAPAPPADLFSDEALSTPEGVRAARDKIREQARARDRKALEFQRRERQIREREARLKQESKAAKAQAELYQAALGKLRGSPDDVISALGTLTGRDGAKVYEEITLALVGKKPAAQASPEIAELKAEIAELRKAREAEQQQAVSAQEAAFVARRADELLELARSKPRARILIDRSPKSVRDQLVTLKREAYEAGNPISDAQAVEQLESYLEALSQTVAGGVATSAATPQKPGSGVQKSLTAAQVASSASTRPMTDDEHIAALASDNEFLTALGLQ